MKRFAQRPLVFVVATAAMSLFATAASAARLAVGPGGGNCTYSTIQAAIDAAASGDTIAVADSGSAYNEKLTITDKSLTISSCPCYNPVCLYDTTHNTLTNATISGSGGSNAPVIRIVTTNANNPITVALDRLTIQDGHSGSTDGGGISFNGIGTLNLTRTNVTSNTADYGAGINFKGTGADATLNINHDTFITYNTAATSGGGIRVEGYNAVLNMNAPNTWVAFNTATGGLGGGLEVINAAIANVGSPGYLSGGIIYENTASKGGGVGLNGGLLNLYTTDPQHPVAIDNNTAYVSGGGIDIDGPTVLTPALCAENYRITNNIAKQGSALYAISSTKTLWFDKHVNGFVCDQLASLGSVPCAGGQQCSIVHGNIAENVAVAPPAATDGAAIELEGANGFQADRMDWRNNTGGYALKIVGGTDYPVAELDNCLIADNTTSHELISSIGDNVSFAVSNCTLAHNSISGPRVLTAQHILSFNYTIVDQGASLPALSFSGNASDFDNLYNIAGNTTGMAASPYNIQTTPTFFDANNGDYRLFYGYRNGALVKSTGVDYAPPFTGDNVDDHDLRNAPRDQTVSNRGVRPSRPWRLRDAGHRGSHLRRHVRRRSGFGAVSPLPVGERTAARSPIGADRVATRSAPAANW